MSRKWTAFLPALAVGLLISACGGLGRSFSETEFPARQVTVGDTEYGYRVYVPATRKPGESLPVMLYLHGSGVRGDDNRAPADAFAAAIAPVKDKIDFIVVIPQCRDATFWASAEIATYALAALDNTVKEFNGDPKRLYLAGFSLGGYGTWQIAAANPGKFAALMPVAGGVVGLRPIEPRDRAAIIPEVGIMLDSPDPYKTLAGALAQTPVWVFHGAKDESVTVEYARKMVATLKETGNENVRYTEYENEGHLIFGRSFAEPGLLEWLAEQKLDKPK